MGPPTPSLRARRAPRRRGQRGASLLEVLIVCALGLLVGGMALEALRTTRARQAGREAARVLLHDLQEVAQRARSTGRAHAVRFSGPAETPRLEVFEDGNANGVRAAEVSLGIDPPVGATRVAFREGRARLAIAATIPTTDHTGTLNAGDNPVRFGIAPFIVFTPRRTASSGSLYVAGADDGQYAIRVLGTTQRWRLLCLNVRAFVWEGC